LTYTEYTKGEQTGGPFTLNDYVITYKDGNDVFNIDGNVISVDANEELEKRSAVYTINVGSNTINPEYYEIGTLTCT
jgi:hypothetical protein